MTSTEDQNKAVITEARNLIIMAGPGSGKTRTVVHRILHLTRKCMVDSGSILSITFTNAGAVELKKRLANEGIEQIGYCGTIHSFMYSLIRGNRELLGYTNAVGMIPEEEIPRELDRIKMKLGYTSLSNDDLMKDKNTVFGKRALKSNKAAIIWNDYRKTLRRESMIDFDLILEQGQELLENVLVQSEIAKKYRYLIVDEVQDSSYQDFQIYNALGIENKFYVGDPDQSLYGFRGADKRIMLELSQSEHFEVITLEQNFRSTTQICDAAQSLISKNQDRFAKSTISQRGEGKDIQLEEYPNQKREFEEVARSVHDLIQAGDDPTEIAVLSRSNKGADSVIRELTALGIQTAKERKISDYYIGFDDAVLAMSLIENEENVLVAEAILSKRFGAERAAEYRRISQHKKTAIAKESGIFNDDDDRSKIDQALDFVRVPDKTRNFILSMAEGAESTSEALARIRMSGNEKTTGKGGVTVSTIHGAKGKEWDTVFLINWEQETIPSNRKKVDMEAERQVAYVAITRARKELFISYSLERKNSWGGQWAKMQKLSPSQFLSDIKLI